MAKVVVYSKESCPYCVQAKELLKRKGVDYQEIRVDLDPMQLQEMMERSGRRTVPQIFINEHHVGGYDDLYALEVAKKLDDLLK
ncbi:MAG: glutaredoxin 3 [Proteobacteria bacterium]|nr:glutaredoxin 3 [Pseudomonadota bacterium]